MPIQGITQPEQLAVTDTLRLVKYNGNHAFAYDWYQDKETLLLVNGDDAPMTEERIQKMYDYLSNHGELYMIEALEDGNWRPVGDVTFWQEDMPIVIGDRSCRGKGIGSLVVRTLVERAKMLGFSEIFVDEIYDYNTGSQKCFQKAGFAAYEKTEKGARYRLRLG